MNKKKMKEKLQIEICFVSLYSSSILFNIFNNYGDYGGAEVQQIELANELRRLGYKISFICFSKERQHNNFNIIPIVKKVNFFYPLITYYSIWKALKKINPDFFVHRSQSPGIVSFFSCLHDGFSIKMISSDAELTGKSLVYQSSIYNFINNFLNHIDIYFSDIIVCQNSYQKNYLKTKFHIDGIIINNAFKIPNTKIEKKEYILWVGTIRKIKNPDIFLDLAKKIPNEKFIMIGGMGKDSGLYDLIRNKASSIPNLTFKGFIPRHEIYEYYQKSKILVSTSEIEGFPNIFIEAWIHSVPVISLYVNPDNILTEKNLGFHSKNFEQLVKDTLYLSKNHSKCKSIGRAARKYIEEKHDIEKIANEYKELIIKYIS